jgi:hypothetical protein
VIRLIEDGNIRNSLNELQSKQIVQWLKQGRSEEPQPDLEVDKEIEGYDPDCPPIEMQIFDLNPMNTRVAIKTAEKSNWIKLKCYKGKPAFVHLLDLVSHRNIP